MGNLSASLPETFLSLPKKLCTLPTAEEYWGFNGPKSNLQNNEGRESLVNTPTSLSFVSVILRHILHTDLEDPQ